MPEPLRPTPVPRPHSVSDRLDSWKQIAAWLGREVRTVQLWEKNEGLPIHRHLHARLGSVYAFKSELDDWREARKGIPDPPLPAVQPNNRRKVLIVVCCSVVVAIAGVTAIALSNGWFSHPPAEPLKGVPLTSAVGQELEPSLSPEGSRVAYSWNGETQDNFDIYVKLIGPGPPLRLTSDPAKDSSPAWSRDGSSIAFLRAMGVEKSQVMVIPSLGGPERVVGEVLSWPAPWQVYPGPHLTWLPDGKGLIVSHRQSTREPFALHLLDIGAGQLRKITSPPAYSTGDTAPALSPDGRSLAFRRCAGLAAGQLYLQRLDDRMQPQGDPSLLTPKGISATSPAWTPDGRAIVYSDGYYYGPGLRRITVGTGKEESLALAGAFVTTALTSPRMLYTAAILDTNVWEIRLPGNAAAPTAVNLIHSTRLDTGAQYSPDGKRIAFLSERSGSAEIWVCDRDGNNPVQLTSLGDTAAPRWSPDGAMIVFLARYKGAEKIYTIRSTGGDPRQITSGPGRDHVPSWSLDGRFVYFRSSRGGDHEVWRVPSTGGPAVQITRGGGELALEAPDGTLYYTKGLGDQWSLWKLADTRESQVLPSAYPGTNFYVTPKGVYFTPRPEPGGATSVQLLRFANNKIETIAPLLKPIWFGLSVAPDERSILYTQIDHEESNLMLVEHLH